MEEEKRKPIPQRKPRTERAITRFRKVRLQSGFEISELNELTHIPVSTLKSYDTADRAILRAQLGAVIILCQTLGCKLSDITPPIEEYREYLDRKHNKRGENNDSSADKT